MEQTMRYGSICLVLVAVLPFSPALAQWVQSNGTSGGESRHLAAGGRNVFSGTDSRGVFLSTNNGTSWIAAKSGLTDSGVGAFSARGANLFSGKAEKGVFFSTDDGTTWTAAGTGPENTPAQNSGTRGTNLFEATGDTLLLSMACGTNWSPLSPGMPGTSVYDILVSSAPGGPGTDLLHGLAPGGVWRSPLSGMVTPVGRSSTGTPERFGSGPGFSHTFNPGSTIRYGLPYRSHMSLTAFNTLGRRIALLANGGVVAGRGLLLPVAMGVFQ
jgi:hypothetical protein